MLYSIIKDFIEDLIPCYRYHDTCNTKGTFLLKIFQNFAVNDSESLEIRKKCFVAVRI